MAKNKTNVYVLLAEIITIALAISVAVCIFMAEAFNTKLSGPTNQIRYAMNDGWYLIDESAAKFTLPHNFDNVKARTEFSIECVLPDTLSDKDYVCTRATKQNLYIYIDGEFRKSYEMDEANGPYRNDAIGEYIYIPVTKEDCGKTIRFSGVRLSDGTSRFEKVYYGEKNALVANYLYDNMFTLVFSLFSLIIGAMFVVIGFILRSLTKGVIRFEYMGLTMLLMAAWNLTQSEVRDLLFSNVRYIASVPPVTLALMILAVTLFLNSLQERRYEKLYLWVFLIDLVNLTTFFILALRRRCELQDCLMIVFPLMFVDFGVFFYGAIRDYKSGVLSDYVANIFGVLCVLAAGTRQIFIYRNSVASPDGSVLCLGYAMLTFISFVNCLNILVKKDSKKKAELEVAASKMKFFANMSHEIRTPMNAVLGMNEAIFNETKDEVVKNYSKEVENAGRLLLSTINDLLDFSKMENGSVNLLIDDYDLREMLKSSISITKKLALDKGLEYKLEVDKHLPKVLKGDDVRVQQVLVNLLTNAIKYTRAGSVTLKVYGEAIEDETIILKLAVSDTGIGIKSSDKDKLFRQFGRVDEKNNKGIEGTGLGLSIVDNLVTLMHGRVDVESEYGVGSTFIVSIPQGRGLDGFIGEVTMESLLNNSSDDNGGVIFTAPNARLLFVDDDSLNRKVCELLTRKTEVNIEYAKSGEEALELAAKNKYDLILLDHLMPGKDGVETLRIMRKDESYLNFRTPTIALTANVLSDAKEQYLELGFDDYLAKPFKGIEMQQLMLKYLPAEKVIKK